MSSPKLAIRQVSKSFFSQGQSWEPAIEEISLEVQEGEIASLIGMSGCGKSTLLDVVAGISLPEAGEVLLSGVSILGKKGQVSYMPQKDVLFPWRTILDNVIIPLEIQGWSRKTAREEALSLLPHFGLSNYAQSYPYALSGGMRQRAAFLRTYLNKKELMLLDEPFGKLDALTRMQMQQWLLEIWQQFKHTVLFVTHDIEEAILLSDRIYVLSPSPGRIVAEVTVPLGRPRHARMTTDPAFTAIKRELLHLLGESLFEQEKQDG